MQRVLKGLQYLYGKSETALRGKRDIEIPSRAREGRNVKKTTPCYSLAVLMLDRLYHVACIDDGLFRQWRARYPARHHAAFRTVDSR